MRSLFYSCRPEIQCAACLPLFPDQSILGNYSRREPYGRTLYFPHGAAIYFLFAHRALFCISPIDVAQTPISPSSNDHPPNQLLLNPFGPFYYRLGPLISASPTTLSSDKDNTAAASHPYQESKSPPPGNHTYRTALWIERIPIIAFTSARYRASGTDDRAPASHLPEIEPCRLSLIEIYRPNPSLLKFLVLGPPPPIRPLFLYKHTPSLSISSLSCHLPP